MKDNINSEIIEQLPGYIGWKNKDLQHLGCNNNLASILRLQNSNKIRGLLDSDFPGYTDEVIQFHKKNDQLVLTGKIIRCIHKSSSPYDGSFFYFIKKPITDGHIVTGLIYHCNEFVNSNFIANLSQSDKKNCPYDLIQSHYEVGFANNIHNLSERELECLFFILRGMTAKKIGEQFKLSKRTIEYYTENIKNKFGCYNKSELISHAINLGYMNCIPPRLLQNNFN